MGRSGRNVQCACVTCANPQRTKLVSETISLDRGRNLREEMSRWVGVLEFDHPGAALWRAAVGRGLPGALRRLLARTRQRLLGRPDRRHRFSTKPRRLAAQSLVLCDRHGGRRRGDRGAKPVISARSLWFSRSDWRCGALRCGFVSTMLRNFAAFAAALAGFTAAIIAGGVLGATGGASDAVFMLALTRASEVCIGIVSAAIVLSWTDFGGASRRLTAQLAAISADIAAGLASAFSHVRAGPRRHASSSARPRRTRHRARSRHRRGDRRVFQPAPSLARHCRAPSVVCSRRFPAGAWRPFNSSNCRWTSGGVKRTRSSAISRQELKSGEVTSWIGQSVARAPSLCRCGAGADGPTPPRALAPIAR